VQPIAQTPTVAPQRCDFGLQNADGLRAAIDSTAEPWRTGRYGEQARALLARHAAGVIALMTSYSELAVEARSRPERFVVTHGEPGPWNVLKNPAGFAIVDWDFVQLAPPARCWRPIPGAPEPSLTPALLRCSGCGTTWPRSPVTSNCSVAHMGPAPMLPRLRRLGHRSKVHGTYCLSGALVPQASSRDEERSRGAGTSTGLVSAATARLVRRRTVHHLVPAHTSGIVNDRSST